MPAHLIRTIPFFICLAVLGSLVAQAAAPFGVIDTPINGSANQAGAINFTGWALSVNTVAKVALCREPVAGEGNTTDPHCLLSSSPTGLVYLGDAVLVPGVRPDVAASYPTYPHNDWGWGAQILTNYLPGTGGQPLGNGTYKLHAIAADPVGLSTDLGTTTMSANNAASVLPFGTIDTPGQGQTISGTDYINFRWGSDATTKHCPDRRFDHYGPHRRSGCRASDLQSGPRGHCDLVPWFKKYNQWQRRRGFFPY
jgi:hypothetical protein